MEAHPLVSQGPIFSSPSLFILTSSYDTISSIPLLVAGRRWQQQVSVSSLPKCHMLGSLEHHVCTFSEF